MIMREWLKQRRVGKLPNPIAVSITVGDLSFAEDTEDHFILAGPYKLWQTEPAENPLDTASIRKTLESINPDDFAGPLVSPDDRSSVRQSTTNRLVTNITELALEYSEAMLESNHASEAYRMLEWAEEFESKTEYGPVFSDKINQLKETATKEMK